MQAEKALQEAQEELRVMFPLEAAQQLKRLSEEALGAIKGSDGSAISAETARLAEERLSQAVRAAMSAVVTASSVSHAARRYYKVDVPTQIETAVKKAEARGKKEKANAVAEAKLQAMSDKEQALAEATKKAAHEAEQAERKLSEAKLKTERKKNSDKMKKANK